MQQLFGSILKDRYVMPAALSSGPKESSILYSDRAQIKPPQIVNLGICGEDYDLFVVSIVPSMNTLLCVNLLITIY